MNSERWKRVEKIFQAALEAAPEARSAVLDSECRGDTDLRADVALLLANEALAGSFLESPAVADLKGSLVGRRLGSYEIGSLLGAGGMGEVYRARDSKLERDVAIKTLPSAFAQDGERLARLGREARTLASLNHPNIAAIYGVEESDGSDWLVLELVEGESPQGPMPVAKALDIGLQIAGALEAAHERGIVHRDLKPANVKVTPDGRVKVLDFGLAKASGAEEAVPRDGAAPAGGSFQTLAGRIMGTPAYMSPEQTRGAKVGTRADLWAYGCLLYELLTGSRAFSGETWPDVVAAVQGTEPDWRKLPSGVPRSVQKILRRCLQKEPDFRPASAGEIRAVIEKTLRKWPRWVAATPIAAMLVSAVVAAIIVEREPYRPADRSRWGQLTKFAGSVGQPTLSPDGRLLTFIRGEASFVGAGQVYVKALPNGEPVQLTHDNFAKMSPTFTPDGQRIAYTIVDENLGWDTWVVPINGGEPRLLYKNASGLIWMRPDEVLFSQVRMGEHMVVVRSKDDMSGQHDVYVPPTEVGMAHRSFISPDRKWAILVEMDGDHYWEQCRLVPVDTTSVGTQVGPSGGGCIFAAWSPDGKWMYFTSNAVRTNHIWRQRFPDGKPELVTDGPTEEEGIAVAPDGRSLITSVSFQNASLWVHDNKGDRQIAVDGNVGSQRFSPDGRKLLYRIVREPRSESAFYKDPGEIQIADVDSGRTVRFAPGFDTLNFDISRDGRLVVMEVAGTESRGTFWVAPLDRSAPPRRIPSVKGKMPRFGLGDHIFFLQTESSKTGKTEGFIHTVRADGSGLRKVSDAPVLFLESVSSDERLVAVLAAGGVSSTPCFAVPTDGGKPILVGDLNIEWTLTGDLMIFPVWATGSFLIPLKPGQPLPPIPAGGFHSAEDTRRLPGVKAFDVREAALGPSRDVYSYFQESVQRNLYRVPLD